MHFCQGLKENYPHYFWPGLFFFFLFLLFLLPLLLLLFPPQVRKNNGRESTQTEKQVKLKREVSDETAVNKTKYQLFDSEGM